MPELFNVSDVQLMSPVAEESTLRDSVSPPIKEDASSRIRRGSSLTESKIPLDGQMERKRSSDDAYVNRFCEVDTTSG